MKTKLMQLLYAVAALLAGLPALAWAQEEGAAVPPPPPVPVLDTGNTAWMIAATALVLMMTIPGLALFYAGMVRAKNVLATMMQCFAITCLVTVLWMVAGYSIAFGTAEGAANDWWGGLARLFLADMHVDTILGSIPESVFMTFQMTFAIITPALIVGAFAERMKFSSMLVFMGAWLLLVYCPIAHWVWGGGWLFNKHILDFAGGTVVHINAGIAGLMAALVLGRRKGYPETPMPPHNLGYTVIGASLLWVGWFGFNAGSELAADGTAGMALAVTQIATATAALAWMFAEWVFHGKPSVLGIASGAVAGLVAITPASGTAGPVGALVIGACAGFFCYLAATKLKRALGYDDSLDAFGVHAIGGIIGAMLTGVFASETLGGKGLGVTEGGIAAQVTVQAIGVGTTIIYTGIMSLIILKVIDMVMGLRVTPEQETEGLDITLHDERGYNL